MLTVVNFFDFWQNNSVFVQKKKGGGILKYEPPGKFIFRQLVVIFAIFGRIITKFAGFP